MSTLFTKIINGEIPGRFVWREADVAAFLTTGPLADGHTLVVPTEEVDRWTDAPPFSSWPGSMEVARKIGAVQADGSMPHGPDSSWPATRSTTSTSMCGPPTRWPISPSGRRTTTRDPAVLDANAEKLRAGLRAAGYAGVCSGE